MNDELLVGLPPRIGENCRVLVLGSMPSAASLGASSYYAHPRNRFWPLMGELFGFDAAADYESRIAGLHRAGIGVWDVIGQCRRRGSLDADIEPGSIVANDVPGLLEKHPSIRALALNGGMAATMFKRHLQPKLSPLHVQRLQIHRLPSTSPANAGFGLPRLRHPWRAVQEHARGK